MKMVRNTKKIISGVIGAVLAVGMIGYGFGVDVNSSTGGAVTTEGVNGTLTEVSSTSILAVGGNVKNVDIETNISTDKWQGFYGSLTGNVLLGAGTDIFHNFGAASFKSVFVVQDGSTVDWTNLVAGTAANVDSAWSFGAAVANIVDQAVDVFTGSSTIAGIGSVPSITNGNFTSGILNDGDTGKSDHVFAATVNKSKGGFDGGTYDYQIMVPVESGATETYYFYASLE